MADQKLTALTALASLSADDLFYVVDDPAGAALSRKMAASVLDAKYLQVASNLSDLANAATARTNLGLAIGTNVQAWDADLDTIAGLAKTDGNFIVGDGAAWVVESGAVARTSLGLGTAAVENVGAFLQTANNLSDLADAAIARTNLGLIAGGAGDIWVEKAGDTMTGLLTITPPAYVDPVANTRALTLIAEFNGTVNNANALQGGNFIAQTAALSTVDFTSSTGLSGVNAVGTHQGTGTVSNLIGGFYEARNLSTGTITNARGILVRSPINSGGGIITNAIGIDILSQNVGSTANIAIRTRDGDVILNENGGAFTLRVEGDTDQNLLRTNPAADTVQIGAATASDGAKFYVSGKISASGEVEINGALNHDGTEAGFYAVAPVARPAAYTQTYATATRVLAAYTSDPESIGYTGIDNAQAGTPYAQLTDLNALRVAYETLRVLAENTTQLLNSVVDDLQANGLLQ